MIVIILRIWINTVAMAWVQDTKLNIYIPTLKEFLEFSPFILVPITPIATSGTSLAPSPTNFYFTRFLASAPPEVYTPTKHTYPFPFLPLRETLTGPSTSRLSFPDTICRHEIFWSQYLLNKVPYEISPLCLWNKAQNFQLTIQILRPSVVLS